MPDRIAPAIAVATAREIDAMTLMGEFLKVAEKNTGTKNQLKGRAPSGGSRVAPPERGQRPAKLADAGISKSASSDAQALATIKKK